MPDKVNNETGSLGNGNTPAQTPGPQGAPGGSQQSTTYHQSGTPSAPAVADGNAGNSNATPLHSEGGTGQETGTGPGIDTGGARMSGVDATGAPIWTETLEAINAIPERIVNALREAELTRMSNEAGSGQPLAGAEQAQNMDAPNQAKSATGPSGSDGPGAGDSGVHWWFRQWGGK